MKSKIFSAFLLAMLLCSAAFADVPSVMMLSTKTCPACAMMSKVLEQISSEYGGKIGTSHIYLEDEPELAEQYQVRYVPVLIFKDSDGKEVAREIGYRAKADVLKIFSDNGVKIEGAN